MNEVAKIKVGENLKKAVRQAVEQVGGFDKFINKGDVVLLKPNFNTADPPPASTDIEFLKAVVELAYACQPKTVIIGESSTMSENSRKTMEKKQVFELEKMEIPPRIYVFDEREWIKKEIPGAKYLKKVSVSEYLDKADKLILLPCLKTHFLSQYTGALKLSIGFMRPCERVPLHLGHLQEKTAELNKLVKPDLVIMDARKCFIADGPAKGTVREPNLILAGKSRIAVDIEGIKTIQNFEGNSLAGIEPTELPQIKKALELGIDQENFKK